MSTRTVRMARLPFSYLNILATNYLLLYSPSSPGECRQRDECQAHTGRPIFSFRSEHSTYDKGTQTGILSRWRVAPACLTLSF
jgi:hypothetical protein